MKTILLLIALVVSLGPAVNVLAQASPAPAKLSVDARMAKARAAKAQKRANPPVLTETSAQKATPADYQSPIDKKQKGPHGEVVHSGERGGKFYINKNGNKTYLSSNQ